MEQTHKHNWKQTKIAACNIKSREQDRKNKENKAQIKVAENSVFCLTIRLTFFLIISIFTIYNLLLELLNLFPFLTVTITS